MCLTCCRGSPVPFGASIEKGGVNFAVFSRDAKAVRLELFKFAEDKEPYAVLNFDPKINRTGDVWHIFVKGLKAGDLYLFCADGEYAPEKGLRFDGEAHLLDPYAKALTQGSVFNAFRAVGDTAKELERIKAGGKVSNKCDLSVFPKCIVVDDDFDWENDAPLNIPLRDTIIYELHVRGFTMSATSKTKKRGTFCGLAEKIPYLKKLGITAVELLPVFEFDENELDRTDPSTGKRLKNFWGYSTVCFFAPKQSYSSGKNSKAVTEFKQMVKDFHSAGIEVILDVVFNHTAEGNHMGHTFSFRGLANNIYYILQNDDRRFYNDYTGCGNTMNCNHPVMVRFIIDCLRYWVLQMHVDGFRFDLASVFCRSESGSLEEFPILTRAISEDPVLRNTKIIAEAWDAAGAYHVGKFPGGRWCSWNDKFRDGMRRFFRGENFMVTEMATRLTGSSDLYMSSSPEYSINFITVHDGFTLNDLVSYLAKHNEANAENNRDGSDCNYSYNNGIEGESDNPAIEKQRLISIKNMLLFLIISQGVPLLLAGDEFRRTQKGNNNAYCQDNDVSWVDWSLCEKNADLLRFVRKLIELRKAHCVFRRSAFFKGGDLQSGVLPDIIWYNAEGQEPDWPKMKHFLACRLDGDSMRSFNGLKDNNFYLAVNMNNRDCIAVLPPLPAEKSWRRVVDTSAYSPNDICDPGDEEILPSQKRYVVPAGSAVLLQSVDILQNRRSLANYPEGKNGI
ncbi:glycogen debranching protein GlgX [Treponema parvum]|uniref:Glycogen debranching protein GlgX n=1 Tax=Treponema parvum TaxID=138851 RepID=A0A975F0S7_9SPIR|nr:glycogen debranching protein GlgX [Treponema parvum]QTQ12476.1 glycogen debranching protein GlgX [Treponema parvum]